jgi:glycosyltransferase involved in cell wall biosynthesis
VPVAKFGIAVHVSLPRPVCRFDQAAKGHPLRPARANIVCLSAEPRRWGYSDATAIRSRHAVAANRCLPQGSREGALEEATVSVVIRAKDKADTIREAIASVQCQTIPVQLLVVDSGSRDATPTIAREMGARVIPIPSESFTYGGAINTGIAVATAEFVLILSAHCVLPGPGWLETALRHFTDSRVAGVSGASKHRVKQHRGLSAEQRLIVGATDDVVVQDRPFYGFYGFSNSASVVRRNVCRQFPFDEELIFAEDKEWANRVTRAGHRIVFDSELGTFGAHRRKEGYRSLYERNQKAAAALTEVFDDRAWTLRKTAQHAGLVLSKRSGVMRLAPFHPANLVEYAGRLSGARRATNAGSACGSQR